MTRVKVERKETSFIIARKRPSSLRNKYVLDYFFFNNNLKKILFKSVEMLLLSFGPGHFIRKRQTFFFSSSFLLIQISIEFLPSTFQTRKDIFQQLVIQRLKCRYSGREGGDVAISSKRHSSTINSQKKNKIQKKNENFSSYWEKKKKNLSAFDARDTFFLFLFFFVCPRRRQALMTSL